MTTYPCNHCNMDEGSPACLQDDRCPRRKIAAPPPRRGTVDRSEWLADKLHNGGEYGKEAAALLLHQAKELDYLRAGRENRAPAWVPARVWLSAPVRGDYPIGHTTIAHKGEHECHSNRYGAVSVTAANGQALGIKPGEFEVVAWRKNNA